MQNDCGQVEVEFLRERFDDRRLDAVLEQELADERSGRISEYGETRRVLLLAAAALLAKVLVQSFAVLEKREQIVGAVVCWRGRRRQFGSVCE